MFFLAILVVALCLGICQWTNGRYDHVLRHGAQGELTGPLGVRKGVLPGPGLAGGREHD